MTSAPAWGQAVAAPASVAGPAAEPVSAASALAAFSTMTGWIEAGAIDEAGAAGFPAVPLATVVLRQDGAAMASAQVTEGANAVAGEVLLRAFREAWSRAEKFVPRRGDALDAARRETFLSRVTLDVEMSGPLVPMGDDEFFTLDADPLRLLRPRLNPGVEGIAARSGRFAHAVTPARMLREGIDPGAALAEVLKRSSGDEGGGLRPLAVLRKEGVALLRFRCTHIAQFAPGEPGRFLERGGRVVELSDVGEIAAMADLATGMAEHLLSRRWPGVEPLGVRGDYNPVAGDHDPTVAPALEQALVIAALRRAGQTRALPEASRTRFARAALELAVQLADVDPTRELPATETPVSAAATAWALSGWAEAEAGPEVVGLARASGLAAVAGFNGDGTFAEGVPVGAYGLVALGLVSAGEASGGAAVRAAFSASPGGALVSQMPYLYWAERRLAGDGAALPSAAALRDLRDAALRLMLREADVDPSDRDLIGGLVLSGGTSPLPTSQSLRPICVVAAMLGDPTLTRRDGDDFAGLVIRQVEMTRFIGQLAARPAEGHMYRRPGAALGGVRLSVWDQRMPTEATVLGLFSLCETLDALGP